MEFLAVIEDAPDVQHREHPFPWTPASGPRTRWRPTTDRPGRAAHLTSFRGRPRRKTNSDTHVISADVRVFIDTHTDRTVNRDNVTLWLGLHQLGCVISPSVGQPSIEPRHENLIERFPSQTRCSKSRSRPAV